MLWNSGAPGALEEADPAGEGADFFLATFDKISKRYAEIQERMIMADGSFPLTGRSIV